MVPQSLQDEALARWSTPREVQISILKSETVLGTLYATPKVTDIPVSLEGNTEVPTWADSESFQKQNPTLYLLCYFLIPLIKLEL